MRRGELPPAEVLAVGRHLATCSECASVAHASVDLRASAMAVREVLTEQDHADVESDLFGYVDGSLGPTRRSEVGAHLLTCPQCREDVSDLQLEHRFLHPPQPQVPARWWYLVAAAIAMAVTGLVWFQHRTAAPDARSLPRVTTPPLIPSPSLPRSSYGRADWDEAVAEALKRGRVSAPPILSALRPPADSYRGASESTETKVDPTGLVVETDRPTFRWPDLGGEYVVSVFAGREQIAQSAPLHRNEWTPDRPLPRGNTYVWQVRVQGADETILPAPPAPPALFRVADQTVVAELEEARRRFPNDHLLLGVLLARAGIQTAARTELEAHAATHPDARRLARSLSQP